MISLIASIDASRNDILGTVVGVCVALLIIRGIYIKSNHEALIGKKNAENEARIEVLEFQVKELQAQISKLTHRSSIHQS